MRGVIFASGLQREVFTAGNDIKELYAPQTSISRWGGLQSPFSSYDEKFCIRVLVSAMVKMYPDSIHQCRKFGY